METRPSASQLEGFLRAVDRSFPVPLSQKQEISSYVEKLLKKATLLAVVEKGEILSLVAGYTDATPDGRGYISVVATLPSHRGRGLAKNLVKRFLAVSAEKGLSAVHLYAVEGNRAALEMYRSLGFVCWRRENEPRPADVHLIYSLRSSV